MSIKKPCYFFNGDSCSYEDHASGQTEDGYCKYENSCGSTRCDSYSDEEQEDEEE